MLKGAIHVHSTFSDGEFTLPELKRMFSTEGCAFVCMTDHAEAFDREKLRAYLQECEALCDERFLFVPGLEYECEQRMHILGYGVTVPAETSNPQAVIRHIDERRGVSVIAHPRNEMFAWIESFETLPQGIEAWNSKYDGQYAPRVDTFDLVQRLRMRRPDLKAFYGQDLHWKRQYHGLYVHLKMDLLVREQVLHALAGGNFVARKEQIELTSNGVLSEALKARFILDHSRSDRMRNWLKSTKKKFDRMGLRIPASIKSRLRGIF